MNDLFEQLFNNLEPSKNEEEILTFSDYLDLLTREPWIARDSMQLLHDMLLSVGVEYNISPGKPLKHRYKFFEEQELIGPYVVFGQQRAKENLVEKIDNASRGAEAGKRLWILLGPPGAAKSRSMDAIKHALHQYSRSETGKSYTLLLPTVDERLKELWLEGFRAYDIHRLNLPLYPPPGTAYQPGVKGGTFGEETCIPIPIVETFNNTTIRGGG